MEEKQISHESADAKRFTVQIKEFAERSLRDGQPVWTDFLDPAEREESQAILSWTTGVRYNSFGGYQNSERRRLVIYPDYYITQTIEPELAFLAIDPGGTNQLNHRDYLGGLMGLGIKRQKIGDLILSDSGCQVILAPELVEFIRFNLAKVSNYQVTIAEIDPEQLNPPNLREKTIKSTVASLRLDAIAALGFSESRTKMVREIKALRVKVNWKTANNPDCQLSPGDTISIRGRGRVVFHELTGASKKGRLGIILVRLL
jgi:RNA-binding protein YlmH